MTPQQFVNKWRGSTLTEKSAAQQHFLDLCEIFGVEKPAAQDRQGEFFTFEKGHQKQFGGRGWADVWMKDHFAWEYKGPGKDLEAAYKQLVGYRDALGNPPLLVVCDLQRIVIHTNFTNSSSVAHEIPLEAMTRPDMLQKLRDVFEHPENFDPRRVQTRTTEEAAERIAALADRLRQRGMDPRRVARFLDRLVFCLFAEDTGLLEDGLVKKLAGDDQHTPERFTRRLNDLFQNMATGGFFGPVVVKHFNGDLFTDAEALDLTVTEIQSVRDVARFDWSQIDPSIFGTLFERALDPAKRAQLGAHYTSREDIETVVEPVVMTPLRREWDEVRTVAANLLETGRKNPLEADRKKSLSKAGLEKARGETAAFLTQFLNRLAAVKILDPACGSGNFLYVALQKLKDLEWEVIQFAAHNKITGDFFRPHVRPEQFHGIEINEYAIELAQLTLWIGYLQWNRSNLAHWADTPVLGKLNTFECRDAILIQDADGKWHEPDWPRVDFIIGNPPFLGNRWQHKELGEEYAGHLFDVYGERLSGKPDLCCYWFEQARRHIEMGKAKRAGLLATQAIRGGTNRHVLELIKKSGDIFLSVYDKEWVLAGANVHISIVGFDNGTEKDRLFVEEIIEKTGDGTKRNMVWRRCESINSNLTVSSTDITKARILKENSALSFQGTVKRGKFDVPESIAIKWLLQGGNPNGRPNSDVLIPYMNAMDVTQGNRYQWVIDFDQRDYSDATMFELPFMHAKKCVKPERQKANQEEARLNWWQYWNSRPEMMSALRPLRRFIATPRVSKHRVFLWLTPPVNPDCRLIAFAREDDYFFGILHSHSHELWSLRIGTRHETRPTYPSTTCFETFPLPRPDAAQEKAIAAAARELDVKRNAWLNPADKVCETVVAEFRASTDGPWTRLVEKPGKDGIGTVQLKRLVPRDEDAAKEIKKRTLTNLYNARPDWLDGLHRTLDAAVLAAYGWPVDITDEDLLARLLALNLERAGG